MADSEKDIINEEFEPDIVELDGEKFEVVDAMEFDGVNYLALIPYDENEEDDEEDEAEFIVLQEVEENGKYFLATIDDDELADKIGNLFLERFDELLDESEL